MYIYIYIYIYVMYRNIKYKYIYISLSLRVYIQSLSRLAFQVRTENQSHCRCSKDILLLTTAAYAVLPNTAQWLQQRYGIRTLQVEVFLDPS